MDYKSVKIPVWAYDNAVAARAHLLRRGLDALPEEVLHPGVCPRCSGAIVRSDGADAGGASVPLGVLLGLGVTALLERLGPIPCELAAERADRLRAAREASAELLKRARLPLRKRRGSPAEPK
jgi:hypothetical protein